VTISWETSRATEIVLKDNHGKTLIDTDDLDSDDRKDFYDGEIKVRPLKDTTYTLTASKGSKDRTCKVSIDVENEVVVLETRDQRPLVSGISLTQVPYTGFEAGPVLTFIFYALLALWGLFVAYVLVVKKKVS
jgi:prolyl oligopeptidase PreP (S9A serine peptidase family)